ncbi:MAG TPA: ABC transporter permease [Chloroflexi bacterium]|nr:ABC transporter permease [Chloroflexota bacterium]HHW86714.1 ABC transporter permease [Chloroflexota bacterium]
MLVYILRRLLMLIPILLLVSFIAFFVIELPPGDWVSTYITQLRTSGIELSDQEAQRLTTLYGFDQPTYVRYFKWITGIVTRGDFGWSFQWGKPVSEVIAERLPITLAISLMALVFSWLIAIPIGIYSATHQYSLVDYLATFIGFIGLATPGFLLAMILAWAANQYLGFSALGLYSKEFLDKPWSLAKAIDMLKHMILPLVIIGMASAGSTIRVLRGNLLDELKKQYVVTARAKGLSEMQLLFKYPVRLALNPVFSTIGWLLPAIFAGEVLISIVLSVPSIGPLLLRSTLAQDMYLTGSIVLILSALTIVGSLISDIYLAWADPRIRYGGLSK